MPERGVEVHVKWDEWHTKMFYGFLLLMAIVILAVVIGTQNAEQQKVSNTDLQQILTLLSTLSGGFAQWAFTNRNGNGPPPPK